MTKRCVHIKSITWSANQTVRKFGVNSTFYMLYISKKVEFQRLHLPGKVRQHASGCQRKRLDDGSCSRASPGAPVNSSSAAHDGRSCRRRLVEQTAECRRPARRRPPDAQWLRGGHRHRSHGRGKNARNMRSRSSLALSLESYHVNSIRMIHKPSHIQIPTVMHARSWITVCIVK